MRFPPAFLDEIRDRVPISSVIGARVSWDKRKTNAARGDFWACCPFHGEKSPSFHCEDRKGRYHCFGCSVSGDHFKFLTELDGLGFPEAVERIADMAGVPMPARDEAEEKRERERATLHDVMEMAAAFFQQQLQSAAGARARAYLRERGVSPSTQQKFRLGFAADSRNALKEHLAGKGIAKDQVEACGLVRFGDDIPVSYDWFRDRIMFPIEDSRGRVIAFGGRAMSPEVAAKYMNSPDTELFHKGTVLYNLARARKAMGKDGTVIAVEGYMDVIALDQAGFANAVAPLGTALTENQVDLLWRLAPEPVLCFDGDQAGLRAAWRAADLILPAVQPGRTARFALLPDGKDPDDLLRADGSDAFRTVLRDARPLSELLWMRETEGGVFDTPERRAELEKTLRELTGRIRDESVRFHYAQDMRERVQAFFGSNRPARDPRNADPKRRQDGKGGPGQKILFSDRLNKSPLTNSGSKASLLRQSALLATLFNHPALIDEYFDAVETMEFSDANLGRLHRLLIDVYARNHSPASSVLMAAVASNGLQHVFQDMVTRLKSAYLWTSLEDAAIEDARDAFAQALHLQRSAGILNKELRLAEAALGADYSEQNYRHFIEIQAQFQDLQATEALIEGFGISSGRVEKG